jgi:site-specific DNA-cytosine methylase
MLHTMAAIGIIRLLAPATFVHENVEQFDDAILTQTLSDMYTLDRTVCKIVDQGWPDMRKRVLHHGTHTTKVDNIVQPLSVVSGLFDRVCDMTWRGMLTLDVRDDTVESELRWATSRNKSGNTLFTPEIEGSSPFEHALSQFEADNYQNYMDKYPDRAYMLQQTCGTHTHASGTKLQMTIISNSGIVMSAPHKRWLFPEELLIGQGFPTTDVLLAAALGDASVSVTSFNVDRATIANPLPRDYGSGNFPARRRNTVAAQAGNSMHVGMIGAAMMWHFGFCIRGDMAFMGVT